MGILWAVLFLVLSVLWVGLVVAAMAFIGALAMMLYRRFVPPAMTFRQALEHVLVGMLGTNNRRWATLLGVVAVTWVMALNTPGASFLPAVPAELWAALGTSARNSLRSWWQCFWGGAFPAPVLADEGTIFGWFFSWEFWALSLLAAAYTPFVFADEFGRFLNWLGRLIMLGTARRARAARGQQQQQAPAARGGWFEAVVAYLLAETFTGGGPGAPRGAPRPAGASAGASLIRILILMLGLALIVRLLTPVPIATAFGILAFLFLLQVLQSRLGGGISTLRQWFGALGRGLGALAVFAALRFLVGQVLGLYPSDAWTAWCPAVPGGTASATTGGVTAIFWGGAVAKALLWEILFLFVAGALAVAWARGKQRGSVKTVFFLSLVVVTMSVVLPTWVRTRPRWTAVDAKLAAAAPLQRMLLGEPEPISCGSGYRQVVEVVTFSVWSPGGCMTDWLVRGGAGGLFVEVLDGQVDLQVVWDDGSTRPFVRMSPISPDMKLPAKRFIAGVRFLNPSTVPVKVRIGPS